MRASRAVVGLLLGVTFLSGAGLGFAYWYDSTGQRPDPKFDPSMAVPTFPKSGPHPLVLIDVAHRNWHSPDGRYRPFAELLRHDGYDVRSNTTSIAPGSLGAARVLVIANALGPAPHDHWDAFTAEERTALASWVREGGALLLIADHVPFGAAAASLAQQFGVRMYLSFARDDEHSGWDNERLIFARKDGLLGDHPIARGRSANETLDTVLTFTGQSLSVPTGATAILRMGDRSYDWESRSVRHSARGHAQAVAMPFGRGRVVVLGEAGVLSAQIDPLGFKMGMNRPGTDDRQFGLNIVHWLSRVLN